MGVVGWEQSYNPALMLDADLVRSESGLTYQGAHPLVTLDNVRSIMPSDFALSYRAWDETRQYADGDKVYYDGRVWLYAGGAQGTAPTDGGWTEYNTLSDFIRTLTKNGIAQTVQEFITMKQLSQESRNLMERRALFDGAARLQNIIEPTGKVVGLEIVPVRAMGVTAKIERVGLQMRNATGMIRLYLFHSSQVAPVRVLDFEYTNRSGGFQWFTPAEPVFLPYISDGTDAGGAWFLCYVQSELPDGMYALNVTKDWSAEPCQTCIGGSLESWRELTKYMLVSPFCIGEPAGFTESPEMFDIGTVAYTRTMNWGINLEMSVGCDLTDFIISQRDIFATVLQKQVAVNVLRTIAMNPDVRVNRNQVNVTREQLLYEIDGNPQGRASGLSYELRNAYKALSLDVRNLDRVCLSCNNHGVRYRTV